MCLRYMINQIGTFILDEVLLILKTVHAIKTVQMVVMAVPILSVRAETIRILTTEKNCTSVFERTALTGANVLLTATAIKLANETVLINLR